VEGARLDVERGIAMPESRFVYGIGRRAGILMVEACMLVIEDMARDRTPEVTPW
jgi:hypothetical protein